MEMRKWNYTKFTENRDPAHSIKSKKKNKNGTEHNSLTLSNLQQQTTIG